MKFFQFIAFAAIAAAGLSARAAPDPAVELGLPAEAAAAMGSIDPERIRAHVKFLADDLLEGRGTGTRGGDIAARYTRSIRRISIMQTMKLRRPFFTGLRTS